MKEEKDIKQQVLDAMDDSVEDMLQHSDAQLESEVGMETLCDILDLDELPLIMRRAARSAFKSFFRSKD